MSHANVSAQLMSEVKMINATLAAFGVDAGTRPAWTTVAGASFVAYGLRTGATQRISDIARLLPELSERLSAARRRPTPVRLREMPLALEVAHPTPAPLDWQLSTLRCGAGRMVAGRNYGTAPAQDCVIDLAHRPHVLVAGTTGSGKSTVLRMLLSSLAFNADPAALRLVLVDRKNEDLVPFARLPHVDLAAWTAEDARRAVAGVYAEVQRRVDAGSGDWARLVLVIDELAQVDPAALDLLSGILAIGRSKRVHVLAATQHPTVKLIGDKSNYAVRLVGQVTDGATAAIATGRRGTGAEVLPGAGAFLYVDGAQLDRLQAYNVTHDAAGGLVGLIAEKWGGSTRGVVAVEAPVEAVVEDETAQIGRQIADLWRNGASKNAMSKAVFGRPYAGSFANKIDKAIAWLESGSTTTTETNSFSGAAQRNERTAGSSSRTPAAPILRMGAR